ncbi:MAG: NAD-dependent epimerase [Syntrophobacteraceae bacterium]
MEIQKPVLVTGVAGFIGSQFAWKLLREGLPVVGLDIVNDYYDPALKWSRLDILKGFAGFEFVRLDLGDAPAIRGLFADRDFDVVVNLAAQAGVRYSLVNPHAYTEANITGFLNVLEGCRATKVKHLVFASSSSVYGANEKTPFSVHDNVDHPVSLYAATKKANELMAHTYAHLYGVPCTGLRFFTVYGPWGRPDMALFLFTRAMLAGEPIDVFNYGRMGRDFTYIDDITAAMRKIIEKPPQPDPAWDPRSPDPSTSFAPYRIYNIGNNKPVRLLEFIAVIEECLGIEAKKNLLPMQPGDVKETYADIEDLARDFGFRPATPLREGIARFVEWYRSYYVDGDTAAVRDPAHLD